jgi:hypothetical protein
MNNRKFYPAVAGALVALLVALAVGVASAASDTTVTVRVEGLSRTLLPPANAKVGSGWITRYGAPKGACPEDTVQGALDLATHHNWRGTWSTQYGPEYEITSILGETHAFALHKPFWEIFVDHVAASAGACELKLHRGEQVLFAAVPSRGFEYPLALTAPRTATVGQAFTVKVVWFNAKGKARPLAGAKVDGKLTDSSGTVQITPTAAGTLTVRATKSGYIRDAVTVHVL